MKRWQGKYTNAQLIIRKNKVSLHVQVKVKITPVPSSSFTPTFLGIDRGITNIATCSDNTFFNSKRLRAVKGRYQYLKRKLQHLGTRSAKRKLQKLSGRERRFVLDANRCISKAIVDKPFSIFVMEKLRNLKKIKRSRQFNRKLGSWSFYELEKFIVYKALQIRKSVILVNPYYTSQTCSRCGHAERANRRGSLFQCKVCGFSLNADLSAARNIGVLGKSEYLRLCVNQPSIAPDDATDDRGRDSYKLLSSNGSD
jgi:IS605 OrfB family transposase